MSNHRALLHLFPDYQAGDWRLQDDGAGPFISEWNRAEPQPSQSTIDAVTEGQKTAAENSHSIQQSFELSRKDKTLIKWIASRTGGGTGASIKAEIKAIWDATP